MSFWKKVILVFIVLGLALTVKCAIAEPVLDVSVPNSFSAFIGEDNYFGMVLYNVGNVTLYNVSFSDLQGVYWPVVDSVGVNESLNVSVRMYPISEFDDDFVFTSKFFYLLGEGYVPKDVMVNFNSSDFSVSEVFLNEGDTLVFLNDDSVEGVVSDLNGSFSLIVSIGGFDGIVFDSIGSFKVFHEAYGFVLDVFVEEAVVGSLAHNIDYDVQTSIGLESVWRPGDVVVNNVLHDFIVDYDGSAEGILEIRNQGDGVAKNIVLSADWVVFDNSGFDVGVGSSKLVKYTVSPVDIDRTNETNVSYENIIFVNISNADDVVSSYSVFVKYHDFDEFSVGNVTYQIVRLSVNETIGFCLNNPEFNGCEELYVEKPIEKVILLNATHELSEDEVREILDGTSKVGDVAQRVDNKYNVIGQDVSDIKKLISNLDAGFENYSLLMEARVSSLENGEKKETAWKVVKWIVCVLFFFLVAGFFVFKYYHYLRASFENFFGGGF
jgi:hypothetical protein